MSNVLLKTKAINTLREKLENNVRLDERMSCHTTFKVGGTADIFVMPRTEVEIEHCLKVAKVFCLPVTFLGGGSNILVKDGGIRGIVISLKENFEGITQVGNKVVANAGTSIAKLLNYAYQSGQSGLEFLSGIPGTVGGGVCCNAGAYGGEISDQIIRVNGVTSDSFKVFEKEECKFAYRSSTFFKNCGVITKAEFFFHDEDKVIIKEKMQNFAAIKRSSQPLNYPSAGSIFKRPTGNYAALLIDKLSLKGLRVGDAMVSTKHAGFIINLKSATSKDVMNLIEIIKEKVYNEFNIELEMEIKVLGEEKY